ncbi:MAG: nucleoside kinase [Oscillospiraceae bacterium]|nr:nucleoside kinase [Oscillospiraceae bacterium]
MNFIKAETINSRLAADRSNYVKLSEDNYNSQLRVAAEKIVLEKDSKPLILLSGPSGSGKTTSAMKIAEMIENHGVKVHTMSMDNYFLPGDMGEMPRDEKGEIDLESPLRLDIPLFSEHLKKLFNCEPIDVPVFEFATQSRNGSIPMQRSENEIIIIEGIHALNPQVTGETDSFTTCLYVSVRTRITSRSGEPLHPRIIRLMRRLSRDKLFRGRRLQDVFKMFESVSRGEELYIMPHKHRAQIDIDTFMAYEAPIYTGLLKDGLTEIAADMENSGNYQLIMKFMNELHPAKADIVPDNSLIREFVGGSSFKY